MVRILTSSADMMHHSISLIPSSHSCITFSKWLGSYAWWHRLKDVFSVTTNSRIVWIWRGLLMAQNIALIPMRCFWSESWLALGKWVNICRVQRCSNTEAMIWLWCLMSICPLVPYLRVLKQLLLLQLMLICSIDWPCLSILIVLIKCCWSYLLILHSIGLWLIKNPMQTVYKILMILIAVKDIKAWKNKFILFLNQFVQELNILLITEVISCETVHKLK